MWPLKHKPEPGEFDPDHYHITDSEKETIAFVFHNFATPDGQHIGMEMHPPPVMRGLVAHGLWRHAEQCVESADYIAHSPNRADFEGMMDEAIRAIRKAYAIHHLPIYVYDLASYLRKRGMDGPAREAYGDYLLAQSHYRPVVYDDMFLHERDLDEAIEDTKQQLSGLHERKPETPQPKYNPSATHRHPRTW